MSKLIRWPGLIGFLAFTGLLAAVLLLFLDTWIRLAIGEALERTSGAEVNIESVSHTLSPFGVTVNGLQMTDPAKPTHNRIQAKNITANVRLMPLFMQKVIIDDLQVSGVEFGQERASEGEVYIPPDASLGERLGLPSDIEAPSVESILERSQLETTAAAEAVQSAYQQHSDNLQAKYAELPDKETLAQYQARLKALKETDYKDPVALSKAKKEFDAIKEELAGEKEKLESFQAAISEAKADLTPKLARLKAAPDNDYAKLQGLIAGDAEAIQDVTRAVLGDKAALWSDYLLSAYNLAAPMLDKAKDDQQEQQREQGRWVEFTDTLPLPDFLIRQATISLTWQQEDIASHWQNITYQHEKIGKPTTFKVDSKSSALWQSMLVNGEFSWQQETLSAKQDWQLVGVKLANVMLAQDKLTSEIEQALLNSAGQLSIEQDVMQGEGKVDLQQLTIKAQGSNQLTNTIATALSSMSRLTIHTDIGGTFRQPQLDFTSDLDADLGKALMSNLTPEQNAKLEKLQQSLNSMAGMELSEGQNSLNKWLNWEELVEGDLGDVQSMLKSQFDNVLDKKKDELKDKLKNKLFG